MSLHEIPVIKPVFILLQRALKWYLLLQYKLDFSTLRDIATWPGPMLQPTSQYQTTTVATNTVTRRTLEKHVKTNLHATKIYTLDKIHTWK